MFVGLLDYVIGDVVSLVVVSWGVDVIEKYFMLDKKMEGLDYILFLEFDELKCMIFNIR